MMNLRTKLLKVADVFGQVTCRQRGRVSDLALGRGGKLQAIEDGAP